MKNLIFLALLSSFTWAQAILSCQEYAKKSKNIMGSSPPINMMIQSVKNYKFPSKISKKDDAFKKLASIETLVKRNVDLVVLWSSAGNYSNLANKLHKVGIDTCSLDLSTLENYVEGYKVLGSIMNEQKRGETLSLYIQNTLQRVHENSQKVHKKLKIYYAKSEDGLVSECGDTLHADFISLIGATNALTCNDLKNVRMTINLEKLYVLNPDVILTSSKNFYEDVQHKSKFKPLRAVRNHQVFLIPLEPTNWLDNPPSFFKTLGILWLGKKVYPEAFSIDIEQEKKKFFQLFLNKDSDE